VSSETSKLITAPVREQHSTRTQRHDAAHVSITRYFAPLAMTVTFHRISLLRLIQTDMQIPGKSCWATEIKRFPRNNHIFYLFSTYALQLFKAYCAIRVRRSIFRHQASPRVSPRESIQRRKVELLARNIREFCLNVDFHVKFRNLLHAVNLRHGTDGFTSPPKEGVLRIFSP